MDTQNQDTPDHNEEFTALTKKVDAELEKLGLYITGVTFQYDGGPLEENESLQGRLADGGTIIMNASFRVGDLAWTDRILNPEEFREKQEFSRILPPSQEVSLEAEAALAELLEMRRANSADD